MSLERNNIVTAIGQLEVELNLSFSPTHFKSFKQLETKLKQLQEYKDGLHNQ